MFETRVPSFLKNISSGYEYSPKNYQTLEIRKHRYNDFIDETIEKYDLLIETDAHGLDFNFGDEEYFLVHTISDKKQIVAEDERGEEKIFTVRTSNLEEIEFVPVSQEEGVSATNQSKATESPEAFASWDNSLW